MHPNLIKALVERGIIAPRTEIDALYRGKDMTGSSVVRSAGTFLILSITPTADGYALTCADTIDGSHRMLPSSAIERVDGMDPSRLAVNYALTEEGEPMKLGKRRGRRPKIRPPALEDA